MGLFSSIANLRALAVQNEPEFFLDVWFDCKCARPMPVYGVPGLVDHF